MTEKSKANVMVIGGGIGGMACALALTQAGFDVEVLEQAAQIGEDLSHVDGETGGGGGGD